MFAYTIRRVIGGILLLVVMSVVTFYLFYASSSTPERFACGPKCTPAQLELTKQALGYDEPTIVQWGKFAKGFVNGREFPDDPALRAAAPEQVVECPPGCLGYSTGYSMPVNDLIKDKLPVSVSLAIAAFCLWIFGGILLGIVAALFKGRLLDKSIVGLALMGFAFPTFFIGLLFLKFVSIRWGLLPLPVYTPLKRRPLAVGDGDDPAGNHAGAGLHGRLHPDDASLRAGDDD